MNNINLSLCIDCGNESDGKIVNSNQQDKYNLIYPYCKKCYDRSNSIKEMFGFIHNEIDVSYDMKGGYDIEGKTRKD